MAKLRVKIALNPHWYSKFWLRQFWQLTRQRKINLYPHFTKINPPACFYFEVQGEPCLIDITDSKEPAYDPGNFTWYFKANYDPGRVYPKNVKPSINGTTLTARNVPPKNEYRIYDLTWMAGISGGRPHKVAMYLALASLPLKKKLAAKMVSQEDSRQWGKILEQAGVEVWQDNLPYRQWLEWNKLGKWNVLNRGKHDCLSFKMVDYMSIGSAVLADYPPTTHWLVPIEQERHYLSLDLSGPKTNDLSEAEFKKLCEEYQRKAWQILPSLQDEDRRKAIAAEGYRYFVGHVADGKAAQELLESVGWL